MRNNQPVTNKEVEMKEGSILVSITDTRGIITMCNQDFIDISGYAENEILGQPHNLVRHPDMPAAAFQDLWETIQAGKPWIGYVKNRCKNGDFYWVTANATPITENGQVTGYMSVRYKPSRAEIAGAEALYRKINMGEVSLEPTGLGKVVAFAKSFSIKQRFYGLMLLTLALLVGSGFCIEALIASEGGLTTKGLFGTMLASFGVIFVGAYALVVKGALGAVDNMIVRLRELAEGDFKGDIDIKRNDEFGKILCGLKTLQIRQGYMVNDTRQQATSMLRIKTALDQVSGNVMIADRDYRIFYINNGAHAFMRNVETDFQKALPNFRADNLMGVCIDDFHKDPSHQRRLLDGLKSAYRSKDMHIGGRVINVIANPVIAEDGTRIATVVEWIDRTEEAKVEGEVQALVESAKSGNLTQRIDTNGKSGFFEGLSTGINELVHVCNGVIEDALRVLLAVAEGKLTESIEADYDGSFGELKDSTNETVVKLKDLISQVRDTATDVSSGASEMASSNSTLNDRTQAQAAALEETASSVEEMTSTVQQNADNARQANQLAVDARNQAEQGGEVVSQAVVAMTGITESSKKISDIISVIDEIAFQTNLLALNAAVEAARAGEQGRGFAVVAGEVRTLAQRSAEAAKEIKELINQSVATVNEGSNLVDKSGEALGTIVQSVQKVSDIIAEIAAAGQEQATGIEQINQAIAQMDNITQQNAALVEETSAGSLTLEQQSNEMLKMVSTFDLGDEVAVPVRRATRAAPQAQKRNVSAAKPKSKPRSVSSDDEWEEF